jgi:hypothetical protein
MDNGTEGLIPANLGVDHLYRAAKHLSVGERAALVDKLMYGCDEQKHTMSFESMAAQPKLIQQINLMTPAEMALVLDAIASKLRNPGANTTQDDH